ncbi:GmrSD restriction endonuclease domain-containing protein [Beduinella massiliensis]|uniref:GmrSD restriction endonuclease domain-containing protein n=1 Tax=Beduinella massiliensis TaxID=1852363 RepID=UPI000C836ECA
MAEISIRRIIEKTLTGEIRIPSFQRGFVWEPEKVAFFIDSLYKGYPIGSLLFWRTNERLDNERRLGCFDLPEPTKGYPLDYVLDGQQRITSIFSVFQTELSASSSSNWMDIYYVLGSSADSQQSQFVPLDSDAVDTKLHFPLNCLFDSVKYRKATEGLEDSTKVEVDKLQEIFKEIQIPFQLMETDDRAHVAIVFERINRTGVPLDSFQLLKAWSWSTDFDLQEQLDDLSSELADYGYDGLTTDQDLLLKCFTGYILGETSPGSITKLNGENIRTNYDEIKNGIKSAVDFIRSELKLDSLKYLPYPAMLVSLVKFFGTPKKGGATYTDLQRQSLIKWFWRGCFSRRYSSGVNSAHESDLQAMKNLAQDERFDICSFKCEIFPSFFTGNVFNLNTVNTKTFIAMLASASPRSFISGANVDLSEPMKLANSKEFHHIFPAKHLQRLGLERSQIYCLANFCFLNNADNQKIKDKAPEDYCKMITTDKIDEILASAICPSQTFSLDYDTFITERAKQLVSYSKKLCGIIA